MKKEKSTVPKSKKQKKISSIDIISQVSGEKVVKGTFFVSNDKGLHMRPSTELVKCAATFKSKVKLMHHNVAVNAKSLLGILTLAASRGARIEIEACGEDAEEAVIKIIELAKNKFYIHY